jgi:hypothetical protein
VTLNFLSHAQANTLIYFLALFLAYIVVVTIAHFFKAWVALELGDATPAEHGFLSWNPLDHIDPIGLVCFLVFGLGWGRAVPINGLNIHGRFRTARIIFAHLSDTIAYVGIGILLMILLVLLFDGNMIITSSYQALYGAFSYQKLHMLYPAYSSVHIAIGFIAICAMYLSIMLGAIQFLINCFYIIMQHYMTPTMIGGTTEILFLLFPLLALIFLTDPIRIFIMYTITFISIGITRLLGLF